MGEYIISNANITQPDKPAVCINGLINVDRLAAPWRDIYEQVCYLPKSNGL